MQVILICRCNKSDRIVSGPLTRLDYTRESAGRTPRNLSAIVDTWSFSPKNRLCTKNYAMTNTSSTDAPTVEPSFELRLECLSEWLLEPGTLKLPDYQRPYQWDESLVTAFFHDVFGESPEDSSPVDFGVLMLERFGPDDETLFVVDGQQRLVTFGLLLRAAHGKDDISPSCRLQTLLADANQNAESAYHIAEAERVLEHLLNAERSVHLRGRIEQARAAVLYRSRSSDAVETVKRLFDDANTTGLPLTGWQILKARHYGHILREDASTDPEVEVLLEKLEAWRCKNRVPAELAGSGRYDFIETEFRTPFSETPLGLDRLADDYAWATFGQGLIQGLFGLLAGEGGGGWYLPITEKTDLHLDPLEPYDGMSSGRAPDCWRADRPLDFAAGLGFFKVVRRLETHVRGITEEIRRTQELFNNSRCIRNEDKDNDETVLATHLRLARLSGRDGLVLSPEHPRTPEALVMTAVLIFRAALYLVAAELDSLKASRESDTQHDETTSFRVEGIPFLNELLTKPGASRWLLGLRPGAGDAFDTSRGSILPRLLATALFWTARFGTNGQLSDRDASSLLAALVTALFNVSGAFGGYFYTIENALLLQPSVEAARECRTPESALWLLARQAPGRHRYSTALKAWISLLEHPSEEGSDEARAVARYVRDTLKRFESEASE